jgi:lysophospholipid acyltransferase (LPLAT)-like uncharacterized protein
MGKNTDQITLRDRIGGGGLYWLSQIVRKTSKYQITNQERLVASFEEERPVIYAGWHGITMMAVPLIQTLHPDMSDIVVLMPDDHRGATLKVWTEKLGGRPYPMNLTGDSTMGMARRLLRLIRKVMAGYNLYMTPDGPDGPSHRLKPGLIYIAKKAQAIIQPIGAYCRRSHTVHRWDRYTVPYPYSRISFHAGEPITNLPDDDSAANQVVTNTLNRVTLQASADYYERGDA